MQIVRHEPVLLCYVQKEEPQAKSKKVTDSVESADKKAS